MLLCSHQASVCTLNKKKKKLLYCFYNASWSHFFLTDATIFCIKPMEHCPVSPSKVKWNQCHCGRRKAASQAQESETLLSNIQSCDEWVKLTTEKRVGCLPATYSCANLRGMCTKADAESLVVQVLSLKPTLPLDTSTLSILCWQKDLPPPLGTRHTDFRKTAVISVRTSHRNGLLWTHVCLELCLRPENSVCAAESWGFCHQKREVDKMQSQYKERRRLIRKLQCGSYNNGILLYLFWYIYSGKDLSYAVHCVTWKHLGSLSKSRILNWTPKQQFGHFT